MESAYVMLVQTVRRESSVEPKTFGLTACFKYNIFFYSQDYWVFFLWKFYTSTRAL